MFRVEANLSNRVLQRVSRRQSKLFGAVCGLLFAGAAQAGLSFPNVPLQSGLSTPANLYFLLDDSGSMQWEVMPDQNLYFSYYLFPRPSNVYGGSTYTNQVPDFEDDNLHNFYGRSAKNNAVFYNPEVEYIPWARADGTSFGNANPSAAYYNPARTASGSMNLTVSNTQNALWFYNDYNTDHFSAYAHVDDDAFTDRSFWPITFYVYKGSGSVDLPGSYVRYQIRGSNAYRKDLAGGSESSLSSFSWDGGNITRTVAEETQNFANWFSYYRSRILAARAGASLAFSGLSQDFRVGFRTINGVGEYRIPVTGTFSGSNRQTFFDRLLQTTINTNGTPLRSGLKWVGEYYKETGDTGPWGPAPQITCRQAFSIVTTDGFWNGSDPSVGNQDGTAGTSITNNDGASYQYQPANPFQDSHSNTLADVAMKYWKEDLRPDLDNDIQPSTANPAFWQHMATFGLSIGVAGTLDPETDLPALQSGSKSWPEPESGSGNRKIDDLWHATVNGRGTFVAARDSGEFSDGLKSALSTITDRVASASNVTANTTSLQTGSRVYQARYTSGQWTGELEAFPVTSSGVSATASWSASDQMPRPGQRNIYTMNDSTGGGVEFRWNQLSANQKSLLGVSSRLSYLRGNISNEERQGGSYRNRTSILGDIVHSSPVFIEDSNTLVVGANDGMVHVFNADTGEEVMAYVPAALYSNLAELSDPNYQHRYFVDGNIAVSSRSQTSGQNLAVISLGRGGRGLVGLNLSDPSNFSGTDVLWEFSHADLGFSLGKPIIAKLNDGSVAAIIGNGYNSDSERAKLLIINLSTGALLESIDTGVGSSSNTNGLTSPKGWDEDGNGTVDTVYAGDLQGNLWKFDLSAANRNQWEPAFKQGSTYEPFFIAQDSSGNRQPITAGVSIGLNPRNDGNAGKRFVFFGTGQFLTTADQTTTATQSWYGLIDNGAQISGRGALKQRSITSEQNVGGKTVRTFAKATPGDMSGKLGWYVDLISPLRGAEGERMVSDSTLLGDVLFASSIVPSTASCAVGGSGFINAIDPYTGGSVGSPFFDLNNDGSFDALDEVTVNGNPLPAGSMDLGIGLPTEGVIISQWLIAGGSTGNLGSAQVNNPVQTGRVSWHEIPGE